MSIKRVHVGCALVVLAGSTLAAEAPKPVAATANVQLAMLGQINPQGTALWDITNDAMESAGSVTAAKIKASDWTRLLASGKAIANGAHALATAERIVAASPGAKIADEGPPGVARAADVQRYIDADTATFRARAARLEQTGTGIVVAVQKRDLKALQDLANHLDAVCEDCHKQYWYPGKKQ
jgi:hypothetical protein